MFVLVASAPGFGGFEQEVGRFETAWEAEEKMEELSIDPLFDFEIFEEEDDDDE